MIILIGGFSHSGKTNMAQKLLEKYKYPYLSIDYLKMALYRADINCGFSPCDNWELIADKMWGIIKGFIMTAVENKQNLIIEGCYLFPQKVNELEDEYKRNVILFYMGFSKSYIEKHFNSEILRNRSVIETRGYENDFSCYDFITGNIEQKELCQKYNTRYFEIDEDYQKETNEIYSWLDEMLSKLI
jgi:putative acetyltransferase